MRPTFRKLEVKDIGTLEKLVAENMEGVEPGLKVVDSRLLLGQAAIDLVGLDWPISFQGCPEARPIFPERL